MLSTSIRPLGRVSAVSALVLLLSFTFSAAAQDKNPGHAKLDGPLNSVSEAFGQRGATGAQSAARSHGLASRSGGRLAVILEANDSLGALSIDVGEVLLRGGQVDAVSRSFMRVLVPYGSLRTLAGHPDIRIARVPTPAVESSMGPNVSESPALTDAANVQLSGITGAGVKVAVIDLGFIGMTSAIGLGELPAGTTGVDFSGSGLETGTAHGVGVAEHVMDMAPGASLYCLKVSDEVDLQNAADYCRNNGISIANHSVGWVIASYYDGTGPINSIIDESRFTDGVFWAVAAGNNAQRHWRGSWIDLDGDNFLEFGGADEQLSLTTTSSVTYIFLNWNQYGNSVTDLDLRIVDRRGRTIASSTASQTGTQEPSEVVAFNYNTRFDPYSIVIDAYSGPTAGLDLTIFSFYNNLEHAVVENSMMDPANADGAFSVAAIDQANWDGSDAPESFSSQGPTNDGRQKPEIIAPDGTTSWTYGSQASYGTSLSSPTTAGAAALLMSEDLSRTAGDIETLLRAMSEDAGAVGWDPIYGHGKLHLTSSFSDTDPVATDDGPFGITEDSAAAKQHDR
ncbi:MAG: S8 family serine peptidase [Candidatus Hydrogenedentota bacterium]